MAGDNTHFDITNDSLLEEALKIAFTCSAGSKVTHFKVDSSRKGRPTRLILAWHESDGYQALPFTMSLQDTLVLVKGWLREQYYGEEPDHDGDNGKGWRIYNEAWTHIERNAYAFCAIEPEWIMYGK